MKKKQNIHKIEKEISRKFYNKFLKNTNAKSVSAFNSYFYTISSMEKQIEFFNDNKKLIKKFISLKKNNRRGVYTYFSDWNHKIFSLKRSLVIRKKPNTFDEANKNG